MQSMGCLLAEAHDYLYPWLNTPFPLVVALCSLKSNCRYWFYIRWFFCNISTCWLVRFYGIWFFFYFFFLRMIFIPFQLHFRKTLDHEILTAFLSKTWCTNLPPNRVTKWFHYPVCIVGGIPCCRKHLEQKLYELWSCSGYSWGKVPYFVLSALFFEGYLSLKAWGLIY